MSAAAPVPEDIATIKPSRDPEFLFRWAEQNFLVIKALLTGGVSGSFTTVDLKTVTVTRGIITKIV